MFRQRDHREGVLAADSREDSKRERGDHGEDPYGATRGVLSDAEFWASAQALGRTPREALKKSCFSVASSSSLLSIKKIEPEAAFAVVVSTSYAAFAVI